MQPEIRPIADQLSTQIRQAEKDLDSIKIKPKVKRSVRIRLSGTRAERVSGHVDQPLILVFAVPHKGGMLSAQAKAPSLWATFRLARQSRRRVLHESISRSVNTLE